MWPGIHRAVSPMPSTLVRRRQWPGCPDPIVPAMVAVQEHALLSFMPEFARQVSARHFDADTVIDQLILDSPELRPITRWNPLEEEEIRCVYYWIIQAISRSPPGEVEYAVSEGIMEMLELRLHEDMNAARMTNEPFYHRRSQRLFRSIADVSAQTRSLRLGSILLNFLISHASHIASADSTPSLGQWCFATARATIREQERADCFRRVLQVRPDLPAQLQCRGQKGAEVAEVLASYAAPLNSRDLHPRASDLHGYAGRLREHELLGYPSRSRERHSLGLDVRGGLDNPGYSSRYRSRSHERRLLLPGVLGDRRDAEDLVQAERLLMAHDAAKQERRMLQLQMNRHDLDRFDRPQALGPGGGLGSRLGGALGGALGGSLGSGLGGGLGFGIGALSYGDDFRAIGLEDELLEI